MRIAMTLLALSLAFTSTACKKKKGEGPEGGSAGSAATGSDTGSAGSGMGSGSDATAGSAGSAGSAAGSGEGSDAMGSAGSAGSAGSGDGPTLNTGANPGGGSAASTEMPNKAGNCPSTVYGSTTKAEIKGKDVVLTITAEDKNAVGAIQRRTSELLKEKATGGTGTAHDQKGTRGGGLGLCPVYFGDKGGTASWKSLSNGVSIVITPKEKPEALKPEIDQRIARAAEYTKATVKPGEAGNQGGVGGGQGNHGRNHSGEGDAKGQQRRDGTGGGAGTGGGGGAGTGGGGGAGTGGGGGAGTGGGGGGGSAKKAPIGRGI